MSKLDPTIYTLKDSSRRYWKLTISAYNTYNFDTSKDWEWTCELSCKEIGFKFSKEVTGQYDKVPCLTEILIELNYSLNSVFVEFAKYGKEEEKQVKSMFTEEDVYKLISIFGWKPSRHGTVNNLFSLLPPDEQRQYWAASWQKVDIKTGIYAGNTFYVPHWATSDLKKT